MNISNILPKKQKREKEPCIEKIVTGIIQLWAILGLLFCRCLFYESIIKTSFNTSDSIERAQPAVQDPRTHKEQVNLALQCSSRVLSCLLPGALCLSGLKPVASPPDPGGLLPSIRL